MRRFLLVGILSLPCFGFILLDDVMSKSVQRRTGVVNLNHNQKLALEEWLNDTFVLKNPDPRKEISEDLYISENTDNGRRLRLNDGSVWEVSPTDIPTASLWLLASPIKMSQSNNPDYPVTFTNVNSGVSIQCRSVIQIGH